MPHADKIGSAEIHALSQLTLAPENSEAAVAFVAGLSDVHRDRLVALADANHVVIRAFSVVAERAGENSPLKEWATGVVAKESQRIQNALTFLHHICSELENWRLSDDGNEVARSLARSRQRPRSLHHGGRASGDSRDAQPDGRAHRAA